MIRLALTLAAVVGLVACERAKPPPVAAPAAASSSASASMAEDTAALRFNAKGRVVAIGDLHGDLKATRAALKLAGAIDDAGHWSGGELTLVQTGDQIDRGDQDREILDLFDRLIEEAAKAGGAVHALNGNHEIMNVDLDFRYVTPGAYVAFEASPGLLLDDPRLAAMPPQARPRGAAFLPGAPMARQLAQRHITVIVDDTVFVHGGITAAHVKYGLGKLDREVREWMSGKATRGPAAIAKEDSPVWNRRYSAAPDRGDCDVLREALGALGAKRMVVGHTVQRNGVNAACDEKVWRIDVGLSAFYGGKTEVLEIAGGAARVLRAPP